MPFLNQERFLTEAVESVLAQTLPSWELLLIDDGSVDGSVEVARGYAQRYPDRILYLEHPGGANLGASASRNLGIRSATGDYIAFLDGDDVWLPNKLEEQVALLDGCPEAGAMYGNTLYWFSWTGSPDDRTRDFQFDLGIPSGTVVEPPRLMVETLFDRAAVPCTCSLLVRRSCVLSIGGFEDEFRRIFTDQVFYMKLFLNAPVLVVDRTWDWYRRHENSSCSIVEREGKTEANRVAYLEWCSRYLEDRGIVDGELKAALRYALRPYRFPRLHTAEQIGRRAVKKIRKRLASARRRIGESRWLGFPARAIGLAHDYKPRVGRVRFGDLRRLQPLSTVWGMERGRPVDRFYIERFLESHGKDVRGRVLEVGDATYTRRFGENRVLQSDVLHVEEGNPQATIVADLASAEHVPDDSFDCIILTQTLQLIFDVPAALRTLRRILKPGGVLLATFPGITHTGDADWQGTWHWSFTTNSARRLFELHFGKDDFEIESHGNVFAATAFLYGLADRELRREELEHHDPAYDMIIAVRAVKPSPLVAMGAARHSSA